MFDVASSEFLIVVLVALVVIGPKDLPKLLRFIGKWTAKARAVMAQFRSGIDQMVRESELKEMEEKWKQQNDHIMREFPPADPLSEAYADPHPYADGTAAIDAPETAPLTAAPPRKPRAKKPAAEKSKRGTKAA